jgi:hypothetical protein
MRREYDDDGAKKLQLTMHGIVTGSGTLVTMPTDIDFGSVNVKDKSEQRTRTFTVSRYDMSPLEIKSVEANVKGITCELIPPKGRAMEDALDTLTVKVILDPKVFCVNKTSGQVARARINIITKREGHDKGRVVPLNVTVE